MISSPNLQNTITITHCDVQGGLAGIGGNPPQTWGPGSFGELSQHDPQFINPPTSYALPFSSPCRNTGDCDLIAADQLDLDGDGNLTEHVPVDLANATRERERVDIGAFEVQTLGDCSADITGAFGVPDGVVNIEDLLAVITVWGACQDCPADVAPEFCGNNTVNIDDLLLVIMNWGECGTQGEDAPQSINDCMNECSPFQGAEYQECMEKCLQSLCERGILEGCN